MATKKSISVQILDQQFNFTTDATPERAEKIADHLSKNLKQAMSRSKTGSPYHAAILVALNLTERYFDAMEDRTELKSRVLEKSRRILGLLETSGMPADPNESS
jgi:cell division protein ZapA (FtsZ GTPase activity inhibitor)